MKNGSCSFFPSCPPCFGACDTDSAPYDMHDNKACDGCVNCRAEKLRMSITKNKDKLSSVLTKLFIEKKIKEEAISIIYNTIYEIMEDKNEEKIGQKSS